MGGFHDEETGDSEGVGVVTGVNGEVGDVSLTAADVPIIDVDDKYNATDVNEALAEIGETTYTNGFDRQVPASLPVLSFDNATRTISVDVRGGSPEYHFWCNGKKIIKTVGESLQLPNTTNTYFIYYDNTGALQFLPEASVISEIFFEFSIVALVYWNALSQSSFGGYELHGIRMDSATHAYNHLTVGARYESGFTPTGFVAGTETFTGITAGKFWDEDVQHSIEELAQLPFIYKLGATGDWFATPLNSDYGYKNGTSNVVYNQNNGGVWELTESTSSTDYMIMFTIATPDFGGVGVKKVMGQAGYSSRRNARNAIDSELSRLITDGLPSPEFVFLQAWIVKRNGDLETLDSDGNLYYDLRASKGGAGSVSPAAAEPTQYCDKSFTAGLALTTTPQLVIPWVDEIPPVGVTNAAGKIYFSTAGLWRLDISRVYLNMDRNPTDVVNLSIQVRLNGVELYANTLPIGAATSTNEPAVLTISSPFMVNTTQVDDYIELFVSAEDSGANPTDAELYTAKLVALKH